jgi:DNA-binding transcriptional LysR family regulator
MMDRFDAMRAFVRVVERRSFTLAAQDLGLPRSTVTDAVKQLEARLGARLLERTTRHVAPTLDGEAYHRRCVALMAELEDAEGAFGGARPKGLLRLEVQGTLARHFLLPGLPGFLAQYPDIEISMSEGERWVDVIREGVDCVLRFGNLPDSDMIARRLTILERLTCASPDYLARFGLPKDVDALDGHRMIGLRSLTTGVVRPMDFVVGGALRNLTLADDHFRNRHGKLSCDSAARPRPRAGSPLPRGRRSGGRNARSGAGGLSAGADSDLVALST